VPTVPFAPPSWSGGDAIAASDLPPHALNWQSMSDSAARHAAIRRIYDEGAPALAELTAPNFVHEEQTGLGLQLLKKTTFPELEVDVNELVDLPDGRVLARITVFTGPGVQATSWPAIQLFRFRDSDDLVISTWSLQDTLPWLIAAGIIEGDELSAFDLLAQEARKNA
jgi:hypothetical protein